MAALVGRKVKFTPTSGGTAVIGARTKTINFTNEGIDITSDDDDGWRTFHGADPAQRGIEMTVEGVLKDSALIELATVSGSELIDNYTLEMPGIGTFTGDFHFGSISLGAPYNEAVTFTATINSSGPVTFTPETT